MTISPLPLSRAPGTLGPLHSPLLQHLRRRPKPSFLICRNSLPGPGREYLSSSGALELLSQLSRQSAQRQRAAGCVELDLVAQQVRLEADRHALGPPSEAPEFVERLLVRRQAVGNPVVLRPDEVVEVLRTVFVDQARQFVEGDRLAQLGLGHGVADQGVRLLAGRIFDHVLAFNEVAERLQQLARLARRVDPFLAADEVAEVVVELAALLALQVRDVLLRLAVVLPFADVDARGQTDVVQVQAFHRHQGKLFGHGHRFGFLYQGNDQVIGHALLVVAEEGVPTGGEVRFFHQLGQVFDGGGAERQEVGDAGQVLAEPSAQWVSA